MFMDNYDRVALGTMVFVLLSLFSLAYVYNELERAKVAKAPEEGECFKIVYGHKVKKVYNVIEKGLVLQDLDEVEHFEYVTLTQLAKMYRPTACKGESASEQKPKQVLPGS